MFKPIRLNAFIVRGFEKATTPRHFGDVPDDEVLAADREIRKMEGILRQIYSDDDYADKMLAALHLEVVKQPATPSLSLTNRQIDIAVWYALPVADVATLSYPMPSDDERREIARILIALTPSDAATTPNNQEGQK